MKSLMGLLREQTPNPAKGTVGKDLVKMIRTFKTGVNVDVKKVAKAIRVEDDPSYGYCEVPFGNFNMPFEQMEENLNLVI